MDSRREIAELVRASSAPPERPEAWRRRSAVALQHRVALLVATSDAGCILLALGVAFVARYGIREMQWSYLLTTALAPAVWLGIFYSFGLYRTHHLSDWEEFTRILSAVSVAVVLAASGSFWTHSQLSRKWIGFTWIIVLALELATRAAWRKHIHRLRCSGRLAMRTLLVGASDQAGRLATMLAFSPCGYVPIGYVTAIDESPNFLSRAPNELRHLGSIADLEQIVLCNDADCLFLPAGAVTPAQMAAVSRVARRTQAELRISTNLPEMLTAPVAIQPLAGAMVLALRGVRLSGAQYVAKRTFDLVFGIATLALVSPILLLAAIAVRTTSRGPVFFRQTRITKGGRIFTMYKFRSMYDVEEGALFDAPPDFTTPFFKLGPNDRRVTRIGRVLRSWSIDELPQLFNVLRGDMSLVGPRPLPEQQVAANLSLLAARHEVSAGVSGWWQIRGRSDLTPEAAVALDLYYIENWSLALDLFILLKTVGAVLRRRGAY